MSTRCSNDTDPIFIRLFLEMSRNAETLLVLRHKRKNTDSKESEALWSGHWQCLQYAKEMVKEAAKRGQLLFCFEGTTVLQGGAA